MNNFLCKKSLGLQVFVIALIITIINISFLGIFLSHSNMSDRRLPIGYILENTLPENSLSDYSTRQTGEFDMYRNVVSIQSSDSTVTKVAETVGPSVVGIMVSYKTFDYYWGEREGGGEGSGIIIKSNGYIITNYHVIEAAIDANTKKLSTNSSIKVLLSNQKEKPYTAQYVGGDKITDMAVLKIAASNLPVPVLGDSTKLKVGELAVAIGNPGGMELMGTVTAGIISGINRTISVEGGTQLKLLQTDAAINPGNSGGALVNSKGEIIGINNLKITAEGYEGLGFAIPINTAKDIANQLILNKYVKGRPSLGVTIDTRYTERLAKAYNLPAGAYVGDVEVLSAADKAGIVKSDIITKFAGKTIKNSDEYETEKNKHKSGETVIIEIFHFNPDGLSGEKQTIIVVLDEAKG